MPSLPPSHLQLRKHLRGRLATSAAPMRTFWATVTAVSAGPPPTVTLQQGTLTEVSGIRYNPAYTPTVGDTVWGRAVGKDYLVEGSLDPATSPGGGGGTVTSVDSVGPDGAGNVALGALRAANNLSDVANAATARGNIGAGTSSLVLGTTATTALAGNTTASGVGALAVANNLSDLGSAATARSNLGLGTAATVATGTTSGTVPLLNSSGRLDMARLASGTPNGTQFVRDDGTLAVPSGGSSALTSAAARATSKSNITTSTTIMTISGLSAGTWLIAVHAIASATTVPNSLYVSATAATGVTFTGSHTCFVACVAASRDFTAGFTFLATLSGSATSFDIAANALNTASPVNLDDGGWTAVKIA